MTYRFTVILGIGSPFYRTIGQGASVRAAELNIELKVEAPADFRADLQEPLIEAAIAEKVDAIIITPCDGTALIEPLRRAWEAGIKIITVDAFLGDGNYADGQVTFPETFIGPDNVQGGHIGAERLFKLIGGRGKVYIQSTMQGVSATDLREVGFLEVLSASESMVELVGIGYDRGSIDLAASQMEEALAREPDLIGIFTTGDYSSKGVNKALKALGKTGLKIVRFDASREGIMELEEGWVDVIIAQLPAEMGQLAVDSALQAVQGAHIPGYVSSELVVITRENLHTPEVQEALKKAQPAE
jgi:ribose transport system substrate-binding protein